MTAQTWDAALYDRQHSFVYGYGKDIVALLAPQPAERILDLGCGTGPLTREIAGAGAQVIGIDGSPEMIAKARASYPELEFQVADARSFAFPDAFDAVFSNAVLHWIPEADLVAARIAAALKSGGRFVAEFGGKGNIVTIISVTRRAIADLLGIQGDHTWYYPSIAEYSTVLERHGLEVRSASRFDRLTRLEGESGMSNWFAMFGAPLLHDVPEPQRPAIIAATEDRLRPSLYRAGVWYADYRRLRIIAAKQ